MRKYILILIIALPSLCAAQVNLKDIRRRSWETVVYRVSALDAIQYEKWDSIPVSKFLQLPPAGIFKSSSWFEDSLALGFYVFISVEDNEVQAELYNRSEMQVLTVNNKQQLQLDVRTRAGSAVSGATVWVNGAKTSLYPKSNTFWVKTKKVDEATVVVYAPADTLITTISAQDDRYPTLAEQRRRNFHETRLYKILHFLPGKFSGRDRYRMKSNRIGARGFIVFNQPKYKPLDTVRLKAYVLNKRWKQYSKQTTLFLSYSARGKYYNIPLGKIKPVSAGAYTHEFVLADSIPSDIHCTVYFKTGSGKFIISKDFKIEDYVPDEMGVQELRSEKEQYFRNDSLRFFASAKDANGLNVMDASARLILTTEKINSFLQDSLFVADTLFTTEKKLQVDGETPFSFSASLLPRADLKIKATLIFKNGNNELQQEEESVSYRYESKMISVKQVADSLKAVLIENGQEIAGVGEMEMNDEDAVVISYPYTRKIDALATGYSFYMYEGADSLKEFFEVEDDYDVSFSRISTEDTLGFVLNNPYKVPVYFTVLNGRTVVGTGKGSGEKIEWKKVMKNRRQMYKLRWQYYWGGEEKFKEESIGLLYKLLKIKLDNKSRVFPGQDDSLKITVTDYKNRPAANVNLTALSYNNQLKKDIRVNDPPYLVKYKSKKYLNRSGFDADEPEESILTKEYLLGKNIGWKNMFGLDSMEYYKLLMPAESYYDAVRPISSFMPQVSVNVVQRAVQQEIYLLYINRQLVYYNGVTDRMNFAFQVYPQNVQLTIRLKNKLLQIDSLYLQSNYKHDLSFDLDNLPRASRVYDADSFFTNPEKQLLENSIWRMQNDEKNNDGFLWQDNSLVKLSGSRPHFAGPFLQNDSLTFFNPLSFSLRFKFEPGYEYNLSKQVLRLEKKQLFPWRKQPYFLEPKTASFILGDTVPEIPAIAYKPIPKPNNYKLSKDAYKYYYANSNGINKGKIMYKPAARTNIAYCILYNQDGLSDVIVLDGSMKSFGNLDAGHYHLFLVTDSGKIALKEISVYAGGTECINMQKEVYQKENSLLVRVLNETHTKDEQPVNPIAARPEFVYYLADSVVFTNAGGGSVTGTITDAKGKKPVVGCSIIIKGSKAGTLSNSNGEYSLNNLRPGKYSVIISAVGYNQMEKSITISANYVSTLDGQLSVSSQSLNEVVVTGYGIAKKMSLTGSITMMRSEELSGYSNALSGKAAGLEVQPSDEWAGVNIQVRGMSSFNASNKPIYVVDGIIYDEPQNIDPSLISNIEVLTSSAATSLYGARAANGVIVISTKIKTARKDFRDYAFWEPNFFTNKKGEASVHVTYPDNITGWQTYVLAFDKMRRMGKASVLTQSYKPMLAQLNLPQFLTEGDSAWFVTKSINYTGDTYHVTTRFSVNDKAVSEKEKDLAAKEAYVAKEMVVAGNRDTLQASFSLGSSTGFKDMEERKIPLFKRGTEEVKGDFWILQKDTSVSFNAEAGIGNISFYAENNTLDMMLKELDHLKKYPYFCMEQICSKVTGLTLEKQIREALKQPFNGQKELNSLLDKIEKAQQFDGGWAWWENGKSDFHISNYICTALLKLRQNPLVEANIRNAFLYLQNSLPGLKKNELLEALATLSQGGHEINYASWIDKINFDSLKQQQQWQWIKIKQQQHLPYRQQLEKLMAQKTETMLGGLYWGEENYHWFSNEVATTLLALEVLKNEPAYEELIPQITQYFLARKTNGYWRNTVETATIISGILPGILAGQENFQQDASLTISGDTNFVINKFPFELKLQNIGIKNIGIKKSGGGLLYFTAYQKYFNSNPYAVDDNFKVKTYFKKNEQVIQSVKAGEKVKMLIEIDVLKDADYVMVTMPIPAGCIFSDKTNNDWQVYKEYPKDKLLLFLRELKKGTRRFEVELEPRYTGVYTLNPAKVELMYYPTFFGRNGVGKVAIE